MLSPVGTITFCNKMCNWMEGLTPARQVAVWLARIAFDKPNTAIPQVVSAAASSSGLTANRVFSPDYWLQDGCSVATSEGLVPCNARNLQWIQTFLEKPACSFVSEVVKM